MSLLKNSISTEDLWKALVLCLLQGVLMMISFL